MSVCVDQQEGVYTSLVPSQVMAIFSHAMLKSLGMVT